jgi:NAD(P)-dependent dehydrogenase (short-subunit alcohol dehydrogenase family)
MKPARTILITGATAGIGRHTARRLAARGHRVFATGLPGTPLDALADEMKPLGAEVLALDVSDEKSIAEAAAEVDRRTSGRGLDILINNAGYGSAVPVTAIEDRDARALFDVNLFGLLSVTRAFLPAMRARGAGRIINVGSVAGRMTVPLLGIYQASKHAVEAISDAMRYELAAFRIGVVLVEPGPINSEFSRRLHAESARYRGLDPDYAPVFENFSRLYQKLEWLSPGPEWVARAIERACNARWPSARYVVPFAWRLLLWAIALLPTRVTDGIWRWLSGLSPRALARQRRQLALPQRMERREVPR